MDQETTTGEPDETEDGLKILTADAFAEHHKDFEDDFDEWDDEEDDEDEDDEELDEDDEDEGFGPDNGEGEEPDYHGVAEEDDAFPFPAQVFEGMTPSQTIRTVALDRLARNVAPTDIAKVFGLSVQTIMRWSTQHTVRAGSTMSLDDIKRRVKRVDAGNIVLSEKKHNKASIRYSPATRRLLEFLVPENVNTQAELTRVQQYRAKSLRDATIKLTIAADAYLVSLSRKMAELNDPRDVINALTAAVAIRSLTDVMQAPPGVESWRDVEKIVSILREAHGMNAKGEQSSTKAGVDFTVLNQRPVAPSKKKSVVVDVEDEGSSEE
jgi:hypothetical protein